MLHITNVLTDIVTYWNNLLSRRLQENISTIIGSSDIATWSWGIFQQDFAKFWPKNVKIIKNFADKAQYLYIFGKYMTVGTSMKKNQLSISFSSTVKVGGNFYPPPIRSAYQQSPIRNRVNMKADETFNKFCVIHKKLSVDKLLR